MFVTFFHELRQAGVPVSLKEYLTLMEAMGAGLASMRAEDFYYLSRATLVKDERKLATFDTVFGAVFKGLDLVGDTLSGSIPAEWLRALSERVMTDEERALIESLGGWAKIMEELARRLKEQDGRH